jgi:hypothetical protein
VLRQRQSHVSTIPPFRNASYRQYTILLVVVLVPVVIDTKNYEKKMKFDAWSVECDA